MLKKVVIIGPESTGKSTLSAQLSEYFFCPWVPEYAREYIKKLDRHYTYEDMLQIAKGQLDMEDEKAMEAAEILICDTDLHVIKVWSEHKYGMVHDWILQQIKIRKYDLYLLTDIDIPWEEDPQREHPEPEMREYFFNQYLSLIRATGIPFERISGSHEERLQQAIDAINRLKEA